MSDALSQEAEIRRLNERIAGLEHANAIHVETIARQTETIVGMRAQLMECGNERRKLLHMQDQLREML